MPIDASQMALYVRGRGLELTDALHPIAAAPTDDAYAQLREAMNDCVARLSELQLWGPDNRLPSSELWNTAGHLLARGWLQNRARTKPRGYAGDYEMLARIATNELCDDPLGRLFDRYFQEQAAPQAVRNRMTMMREWIVDSIAPTEQPRHIAVVGSAFGMEVRNSLLHLTSSVRERLRVTLLDLDPDTLDFASRQVGQLVPRERLTLHSSNLFRLADRPKDASFLAQSDLLLCPGLFDYLDDAAAATMLRTLYRSLSAGGRLVVFQFAPHNPTRGYMEWFGNWYLTYRSENQLRGLATAAGIPQSAAVYGAEPLGVILYLSATA